VRALWVVLLGSALVFSPQPQLAEGAAAAQKEDKQKDKEKDKEKEKDKKDKEDEELKKLEKELQDGSNAEAQEARKKYYYGDEFLQAYVNDLGTEPGSEGHAGGRLLLIPRDQ